jgi:predicted proteasome-type protease
MKPGFCRTITSVSPEWITKNILLCLSVDMKSNIRSSKVVKILVLEKDMKNVNVTKMQDFFLYWVYLIEASLFPKGDASSF